MQGFSPAIVSALRGYRRGDFLADLGAGLTVGLVALPLAIGFGIASGVTPLRTGIIASLVVALLGGTQAACTHSKARSKSSAATGWKLSRAVRPQPMKVLFEAGLAERIGLDHFCADIDQALAAVRELRVKSV
jgi:MFS superfamily sulfate permease-like transporter